MMELDRGAAAQVKYLHKVIVHFLSNFLLKKPKQDHQRDIEYCQKFSTRNPTAQACSGKC
jgi:hypothetical protein